MRYRDDLNETAKFREETSSSSPIQEALQKLHAGINEMESDLAVFVKRAEPVLRPDAPSEAPVPISTAVGDSSDVTRGILIAIDSVDRIRRQIINLQGRLDL
jgi:hypothetical protein